MQASGFPLPKCFMIYSFMDVEQTKDGKNEKYRYEYPSSIFKKHIIKFLTDHINSWDSKYAFNGENEVIDFYNEVIKIGTIIPQ